MNLQQLSRLNTRRSLTLILGDWLIIAAAFAAYEWIPHWTGLLLAIVVIGNRQHALGLMGHEGVHYLLHRHPRINDWLAGALALWPIGNGVDSYRSFHFDHHRYLGTDRDPELQIKKFAAPAYDLPTTRWFLLRQFFADLIGLSVFHIFEIVVYLRMRSRFDLIGSGLWWTIVTSILVMTGHADWLAIWFVALCSSFWMTFRMRIWSEHTGTRQSLRLQPQWWWRALFMAHHTGYHFEHHRWPTVPCWNLSLARRLDQQTPILSVFEAIRQFEKAAPTNSGVQPALEVIRQR